MGLVLSEPTTLTWKKCATFVTGSKLLWRRLRPAQAMSQPSATRRARFLPHPPTSFHHTSQQLRGHSRANHEREPEKESTCGQLLYRIQNCLLWEYDRGLTVVMRCAKLSYFVPLSILNFNPDSPRSLAKCLQNNIINTRPATRGSISLKNHVAIATIRLSDLQPLEPPPPRARDTWKLNSSHQTVALVCRVWRCDRQRTSSGKL
jgi:hypothetical protein